MATSPPNLNPPRRRFAHPSFLAVVAVKYFVVIVVHWMVVGQARAGSAP